MSAQRIDIYQFLSEGRHYPILDVRSPAEYAHAHIPGAHSLPLFTDEERKIIGTTYKQQSQQLAIKAGLDFFGPRMRQMVEQAEAIVAAHQKNRAKAGYRIDKNQAPQVLVHCWRGGMRSGAVAWLLDLYGFKVKLLEGGYKAFRHWCLDHFKQDYPYQVLGGYTGSGKTRVLHELARRNQSVLDLEGIARHRGSAFGALDREGQPSQESFENRIAWQLQELMDKNPGGPIWVEDESQRIGQVNMPMELWQRLRRKPLFLLDIPFEARLRFLCADYGAFDSEKLVNAMIRIRKRLGPLETKTAIACLLDQDLPGCFAILLRYYDKQYAKSMQGREAESPVYPIAYPEVAPAALADHMLKHTPHVI